MIRERGDAWQVDVQVNGRRFRKNVDTRAEAEKLEASAITRMKQGLPAEPAAVEAAPNTGTTLAELRDLTVARFWSGTPNERTATCNADDVVRLLGPTRHPASIGPLDVDNLVAHYTALKLSPATINRKLSCLTKMLRFAHLRGLIPSVPVIERKRESQGRLRWYTEAEEDRILQHLETTGQHDFRELAIFLLDTGCRASEAARATWQDFDAAEGMIHLWRTKNGKNRGVPLPARCHEVLTRRAARRMAGCSPADLIFPGWTGGRGDTMPMTNAWVHVREALKLGDDAVLHALRHTYASRLVQRAVPLNVVQGLLGHGSPAMTMRYAHLAPVNFRSAVATLDRVTPRRTGSDARSQGSA
jgi:integrase